jgi:N-6 DNA methylase
MKRTRHRIRRLDTASLVSQSGRLRKKSHQPDLEMKMSKTTHDRGPPKSITKLITGLSHRHSTWQVFNDFVEMAAISISNAIDFQPRDKREARYMEIVKRYKPDEIEQFPRMMGELIRELEEAPNDVLGRVFNELELHNKWAGQFFTPYHVCQMMAKMTLGGTYAQSIIEERGYITAQEPACGSGSMVIALAQALKDEGINYQQQLHVTAIDVDAKCVHMAYLQLSLLHIPAIIVHGNSLSLEEYGQWYTPAHIMGGWGAKLRNRQMADETPLPVPTRPQDERPAASATRPTQLSLF